MSLTEQMKRNGLLQSQVVLDYFICGKNGEKNKEGAYAPSLFFSPFFPQIKQSNTPRYCYNPLRFIRSIHDMIGRIYFD